MSPLRFARPRKWQRAFLSASCAALLSSYSGTVSVEAAPAKVKRSGSKSRTQSATQVKPAAVDDLRDLEWADILPSEFQAGPDLALKPEDERKAQALTAFSQAVVFEDGADTDKALEGYRKTLEFDPSYAELSVKVAYELARRNDVSGGIQVLKDTIKVAPTEPLPLIYLSQLYGKYLKKQDLALKYAEQAATLAPAQFASYLALFELHVGANESKKAEQVLVRAAKANSKDAKFWIQLGDLHTRLYLKEDGASAPAELERMTAVYLKAAELGKDDAGINAKVGDFFVLSRQEKRAIAYYLSALRLSPAEAGGPLEQIRAKLAAAFEVTDQRDEAIALLEQSTKDNPLRFDTFEFLGELYEKKGDLDRAVASYEHALLLDAKSPQNYLRLTETLLRSKKIEKAVETMKTARAKFPDVPQITLSFAITLSQAKKHTEAMTAFAEARGEAANSHEEMLTAGFYLQYGAAAEQAGLTERAADLLRQSIALEPGNPEAYNYLGYMWVDRGENLDEAGEMIKKALELDPDNGAFLDSLGWFYYKKGDAERAVKELLRAAEIIKTEDAVVFEHIGDAYHKLGRAAEALTYWRKALALEKENPKVAGKIDAAQGKVTKTEVSAVP